MKTKINKKSEILDLDNNYTRFLNATICPDIPDFEKSPQPVHQLSWEDIVKKIYNPLKIDIISNTTSPVAFPTGRRASSEALAFLGLA